MQNAFQTSYNDILSTYRECNAQVIIFCKSRYTDRLWVLIQLRSRRQAKMAYHLGGIGGKREWAEDSNSLTTAFREVMEETGAVIPKNTRLTKFSQGQKCDWFFMLLDNTDAFQKGY